MSPGGSVLVSPDTKLDDELTLADFDRMSWPDFDDLATWEKLERLSDPLYRWFARSGLTHVLWQLSRVVGLVACQKQGSSVCPPTWKKTHPVLERLFALIDPVPVPSRPRRPRQHGLAIPPRLWWDLDLQQTIAVLPEQRLPEGAGHMAWEVIPGGADSPETWPDQEGIRVAEAHSYALRPAPSYAIDVIVRGDGSPGQELREHYRFDLPEDFVPAVLFATDGTLLSCKDGDSLSEGEYLALVPRGQADRLFERTGVHRVERVARAPVGWRDWCGWRIRLDPAAEVTPYVVRGDRPAATWELETCPEVGVPWREHLPVWSGGWPRLFVSDAETFRGAIIEVETIGGQREQVLRLIIGDASGVPIGVYQGRPFLELSGAPGLRDVYGRIHLRCRPPAYPDQLPLEAGMVRVPEIRRLFRR